MSYAPATTPRPRQPRVLHVIQLSLGSSLNHIVLVRSALIPLVTSHTAYMIADLPHIPTQVFLACFVLTRTLFRKLPRMSLIPKLFQVKHA